MGGGENKDTFEDWGNVEYAEAKFTQTVAVGIDLFRENITNVLQISDEITKSGADIAVFNMGSTKLAVATNYKTQELLLKSPNVIKPGATKAYDQLNDEENIVPGVLGASANIPEHKEIREIARGMVKAEFNEPLNDIDFIAGMNERTENVIRAVNAGKDYDDAAKVQRLEYFRSRYFSNSINSEQMGAMYAYIEGIFGTVLSATMKDPIRRMRGKTWHEFTPKSLREGQQFTENLLFGEIELRRIDPSIDDALATLVRKTDIAEMNRGLAPDQINWRILTNFSQILFASTDTTPAAIGGLLYTLANDVELQNNLRIHAKNIQQEFGRTYLTVKEMSDPNSEDLRATHRVVGRNLAMNPPTETTARMNILPIRVANGFEIPPYSNIFISLSTVQQKLMAENPRKYETFAGLMDLAIYGGGAHVCIGRANANVEQVNFLIHLLATTEQGGIQLTNPEEVRRISSGTSYFDRMKFRFLRSEA